MGLFSNIKAIRDVQRIRSGGTANLSISQITCLITNMQDARKNLSSEKFEAVYALFNELRKCKIKMKMDINGYYDTAVKIIKRFDVIAPYEKYSGGNELEFSFLMEEIRDVDNNANTKNELSRDLLDLYAYCDPADAEEDINHVLNTAPFEISREDVKAVLAVVCCNHLFGKEMAIEAFDTLAKRIIAENSSIQAALEIPFLSGLLYANKVVGKEESDALEKKYIDPLLSQLKQQ